MSTISKIKSSNFTIRTVVEADLADIVRIHQAAFKGFFLDRMGPRFLRAYYQSVVDFPDSIFLISLDREEGVNGFAVGFINPDAFYKHFRAQRIRLMPIIIEALLCDPSLFIKVARNTRRLAKVNVCENRIVELSSIGTSRRGTGIGTILLDAFCTRSAELGANRVMLTTDRDDNTSVVKFYLAHGFEPLVFEQRGRRVLQIMTKNLPTTGR